MIKCEKSLDNKHSIRKEIIKYDELSNGYGCVGKIPIFADVCMKCGKIGKVYKDTEIKQKQKQ